jgi:autotransporter-associated beta strand protein
MKMIRAVCVAAVVGGGAFAAERTWTGGAGNAFFSGDANWSPAGAPQDGDALRFANASALEAVNDLEERSFAGLTASGAGALTLGAAGNAFTLTGNLAVEGAGALTLAVPVEVATPVTFTLTNANLTVAAPLTGAGGVTLEGGRDLYANAAVTLTGGVTVNRGRLRVGNTGFTAPVTLNQYAANGIVNLIWQTPGTYAFPLTVNGNDGSGATVQALAGVSVTNTAPVTIGPNAYTRWRPDGRVTFAGGINLTAPIRADFDVIFNGNITIAGVPLAFTNQLYFDNGNLRLAVAGNSYSKLVCYAKTLSTDVPNALDPGTFIQMGTGWSKNSAVDLNGNDQTIDRVVINGGMATPESSYVLSSSSGPATLTCRASASTVFLGSIDGALTLLWAPLSDAHTMTLTGRVSNTTGALAVSSGTLRLTPDTSFPNLGGLAATGTGVLRLDAGAQTFPAPLTLADAGVINLADGLALTCTEARVDGFELAPGTYTAASNVNGRAFITGGGALTVLGLPPLSPDVRTWTGAGADTLFSNPANWDAAPRFDGSETFAFDAAGSSAVVDGDFRLGALRFNRAAPFALTPASAGAALRLGFGGIAALAPSPATVATNTVAVPLTLFAAHDINVASNQTLAVTASVSGGVGYLPVVKIGDGTLHLTATNTFASPLVISNGFVRVNTGTALGDPTGAVTIARNTPTTDAWNQTGALYFTDTNASCDRAITLAANVAYLGQIYPAGGILALNGRFTCLTNTRIDNNGTLIFRGGYQCRSNTPWLQTNNGRVTRFENLPLDLGGSGISADNGGTFHVCTTGNVWSTVGLYSATFLCGAAGALPTNSSVVFGTSSYTQRGTLDLNGYDQQVKCFYHNAYSGTPTVTNMQIRSAAPATLTVQGDTAARSFVGCFTNQAALTYRCAAGSLTFTGLNARSWTAGALTVDAGTVAFRNGAAWRGSTNVTVTAGTLCVEGGAGDTFGGPDTAVNQTRLHLTSAATVDLAEGVEEWVNAGTLDGANLPVGTYGSAASAASTKSPLFTGTGLLHVMRDETPGTVIFLR